MESRYLFAVNILLTYKKLHNIDLNLSVINRSLNYFEMYEHSQ